MKYLEIKLWRFRLLFVKNKKIDFIVSDRYQYIVSKDILEFLEGNAINTHPSLLPLQRGYHPNFFSIYRNTKKGVTIHYMDEGLDTGNIVYQKTFENPDYSFVDEVFDAHIRSETLIDVLKKELLSMEKLKL